MWVSIKNIISLFRICLNLLSFNFSIVRPPTFQTNMVKFLKFDNVLIASTTIKNETKPFYRIKISEASPVSEIKVLMESKP